MTRPKVFVSLTYIENKRIQLSLQKFFESYNFDVNFIDNEMLCNISNNDMVKLCYQHLTDSDIFFIIIGDRFCNFKNKDNIEEKGSIINSHTINAFLEAEKKKIPVYVYIDIGVQNEFQTYQTDQNERGKINSSTRVDAIPIYHLITEIYKLMKNKLIYSYKNQKDIANSIKSLFEGVWNQQIYVDKKLSAKNKLRINSYKLFFYRSQRNISFKTLSQISKVSESKLKRLEKLNQKKGINIEHNIFPSCDIQSINKIEAALECYNTLSCGLEDDFLSAYIQYYATYKGQRPSAIRNNQQQLLLFPTKAVVFDFDGTLTERKDDLSTWERIWLLLNYDLEDCAYYHRQYSEGYITHSEWCDLTCEKFKERNLQEQQLNYIARSIQLINGTQKVIEKLHAQNIKLYILSGSILTVIRHVINNLYDKFEDILANELIFENGKLKKIIGTKYDFEGKADYLKHIIFKNQFSPLEVLFVGNSCNDVWASQSGAKTLCINPRFTNPHNVKDWTYYLRKVDDMHSILEFV